MASALDADVDVVVVVGVDLVVGGDGDELDQQHSLASAATTRASRSAAR